MIYLDHAATTPVDPRVLKQMLPHFSNAYANASSKHAAGKSAASTVSNARSSLARHMSANPSEIVFTAGASEANNLALKGVIGCECFRDKRLHLITSEIEHKSVLETMKCLAKDGHDVTFIPAGPDGTVDPAWVQESIRPNTVLVSIMHVNNETGAVQPIADIAEICYQNRLFFHTDATQSFGKLNIDNSGIDLVSVSAHKLYGPKGIGFLFTNESTPISCQISGGSQEGGLRAGTLNVPGIVGMQAAADIAALQASDDYRKSEALRARFLDAIFSAIPGVRVNGSVDTSVPWIMNLSFEGVGGHALRDSLGEICVSCSSACSKSTDPSHVLKAMGVPEGVSSCAVRISTGRFTTQDEMDEVAQAVAYNVARIRGQGAISV